MTSKQSIYRNNKVNLHLFPPALNKNEMHTNSNTNQSEFSRGKLISLNHNIEYHQYK